MLFSLHARNIHVSSESHYRFADNTENVLNKFMLVFVVKARDLDAKKSIVDCLYEQLMPEDFKINRQEFQDQIKTQQERILIIVDGFDEMMEQHADLNKLLSGKILSHISVLVTSRPGFALNMLKYFDSIFVIVGYGEQQRLEFIDKFLAAMDDPRALPRFEAFKQRLAADDVLGQLCRNPLHICILCMLVEDSTQKAGSTALPQTKTELYEEMEEFIIRRSADSLCKDYDELKTVCSPLDKIAYNGLLQGKNSVAESEAGE